MLSTSHVLLAAIAGVLCVAASARELDLYAQIDPPVRAEVTIHGTDFPFAAVTSADSDGRFRFRRLEQGVYSVGVYSPSSGEVRRTVRVSAMLAGKDGRIRVTIPFQPSDRTALRVVKEQTIISFEDYCTPPFAVAQYERAQEELGKHDVEAARKHLRRAVEVAPGYSDAWNNLGTIAYQTGNFKEAERHFREALKHKPEAYSPLVNLGGTLLALEQNQEALEINRQAHQLRPDDALASAQLGLSLLRAGNLSEASQHLRAAKKSDPAHYTHPQLALARIYSVRGETHNVITELEEFLSLHPDAAGVQSVRSWLDLVIETGDPALAEVIGAASPASYGCDW